MSGKILYPRNHAFCRFHSLHMRYWPLYLCAMLSSDMACLVGHWIIASLLLAQSLWELTEDLSPSYPLVLPITVLPSPSSPTCSPPSLLPCSFSDLTSTPLCPVCASLDLFPSHLASKPFSVHASVTFSVPHPLSSKLLHRNDFLGRHLLCPLDYGWLYYYFFCFKCFSCSLRRLISNHQCIWVRVEH